MAEKRKVGRPKAVHPPAKKTRLSTQVKQEETPEPSPTHEEAEEDEVKPVLLPNRVYDSRPLPTIREPQPAGLSDDDYQSIDSSRTLAMSLERSRKKWLAGDFLERYWTRVKKTAQIQSNPSKSSMGLVPSGTSTCTLIVEPLIFEARVYYVKDTSSAASTPYKPAGAQQGHNAPVAIPHATAAGGHTGSTSGGQASGAAGQTPQPPKQGPERVIQLLASRASSDPALKELMKVVATGLGTQAQLQAFQQHIDELNAIVDKQKAAEAAAAAAESTAGTAAPSRTSTPQSQTAFTPPPPRPVQQAAPRYRGAAPPSYPVVLEFLNPGASPDRFFFPRHAIIEPLGSYSVLASFLVLRKGSEAADPAIFSPDKTYFEPVTIKIDVQPNDLEVLAYLKRSVKPADEVRVWMLEQMRTHTRAEIRYLPLRLPVQSQLTEAEEVAYEPPPVVEVKKRGPYKKKADKEKEKAEKEAADAAMASVGPVGEATSDKPTQADGTPAPPAGEGAGDASSPKEGRRVSKRSARLRESLGA